jgi:hypothetical protein
LRWWDQRAFCALIVVAWTLGGHPTTAKNLYATRRIFVFSDLV